VSGRRDIGESSSLAGAGSGRRARRRRRPEPAPILGLALSDDEGSVPSAEALLALDSEPRPASDYIATRAQKVDQT
jgi:hypothetical protein